MSKTNRLVILCGAVLAFVALGAPGGCGGGPSLNRSGNGGSDAPLDVRVSAGGPVSGATVTVYAAGDDTGGILTIVGDGGVIGTGGPTDESGKAAVRLSVPGYPGPVQIVASGAAMTYPDPTVPSAPGQAPVLVQIPASFILSSYLRELPAGGSVPVTLLGTLADHEALAYAHGLHLLHPGRKTLSQALSDRDRLFVQHLAASASAWDPGNLRTTVPASLTVGPQTLVDTAYAALFDLALNELARQTAQLAGYGTDSRAFSAITLAQLLEQDLDADGQFNGRGENGQFLSTPGQTPVPLTSQFLRIPLAQALDRWIQNRSVNQSGITQADLVSAGVYNAITQDSSDLFGDAPAGPFDPVDHAPPELSLASTPPAYTNQTSITLVVNATDPSGVKAVYAQNGSAKYTAVPTNGAWQVSSIGLATGPNTITIWAEDSADPSNSGLGKAPPYQLTVPITLDTTPPSVTLNSFQSYYSESGMSVGVDSSGKAIVPLVPIYASTQKVAIGAGGDVYKASTRLGWTVAPTAAVLEQANPDNIPVLQFTVPFNPLTDAPITTATFSAAVTCPGCSYPTVTGNLWSSPTTSPGLLYFDLPLADNLIPALDTLPGPATLAVTVFAADAAGNSSDPTATSLMFHVVGSPVAVQYDSLYSQGSDPKSTFPYLPTGGSYGGLFLNTNFLPDQAIRLIRYVVTNPGLRPVALGASITGSNTWTLEEVWRRDNGPALPPKKYWVWDPDVHGAKCPDGDNPPRCDAATQVEWTQPYGTSTVCQGIWAVNYGGMTGSTSPQKLTVLAYQDAATPAARTLSSDFIVPAATASGPGALFLYVARPFFSHPATLPPLFYDGKRFTEPVCDAWSAYSTTAKVPAPCMASGAPATRTEYVWNGLRYIQYLYSAHERASGTLSLLTSGVSNTTEIGEPQAPPPISVLFEWWHY